MMVSMEASNQCYILAGQVHCNLLQLSVITHIPHERGYYIGLELVFASSLQSDGMLLNCGLYLENKIMNLPVIQGLLVLAVASNFIQYVIRKSHDKKY